MENENSTAMKKTTDERRRAQRAFQKVRNASSLTSSVVITKNSKAPFSGEGENDWSSCEPLQRTLLEAEMKVLELAASGTFITDYATRSKTADSKEPPTLDISFEIDTLFTCVASKPSQKMRQYLNKSTITPAKRNWARSMIIQILQFPLQTFFKMGDILARALRNVADDNDRRCKRLRQGLIRILMYISDCLRYSHDHTRSKAAAELMRLIAPGDAEAHMRIGMNLTMIDNQRDVMRPFFHYCVFLANRNVRIGHGESGVVANLVRDIVRVGKGTQEGKSFPVRTQFFCLFIETLWCVLSSDFDKASAMVHSEQLWKYFADSMQQGLTEMDMLHVVGTLMFAHYRVSPKGCENGGLLPERELTDALICNLLIALCSNTCAKLELLIIALRSRKRNRRRAMQKKRRLDAGGLQPISAEALGCELFKTMINMDKTAPHLGAASFLAHFWSKARMAPSPSSDLTLMARTLKALQSLTQQMAKVEEITVTTPITAHIGSKLLAEVRHRIPALPEDISFSNFRPCTEYDMFSMILLQEVPLAKVLEDNSDEMIKPALQSIGETTFESLVATTSRRHLDAFSHQSAKEASEHAETLGKEASSVLVAMVLRTMRLQRLIRDLEKVAGGKLAQMWNSCSPEADAGEDCNAENPSDHPPPAAQLDTGNCESLHEHISPEQLGAQVRKRRRLIGSCSTPGKDSRGAGARSGMSSILRPSTNTFHGRPESNNNEMVQPRQADDADMHKNHVNHSTTNILSLTTRQNSLGGLLSQGSLHLCYAQPIEPNPSESVASTKRRDDLSYALRQALYPAENEFNSAKSLLDNIPFWRRFPKEDMAQDLCHVGSQASY